MHYDNEKTQANGSLRIKCTRFGHQIDFQYRLDAGVIQKIGQWPSFADIALDESKQYTRLLTTEDSAEFHKAIGLAAHGVGIGSFVYLRRIFERLIQKRYLEFKDREGWRDEDFKDLKMAEKVTFLKGHLPAFLVKNSKIYSILSLGLHELSEEECLAFFSVLRQSTVVILEEDKKKREELDRQKELEKAIVGFSKPKKESSQETSAALGAELQVSHKESTE